MCGIVGMVIKGKTGMTTTNENIFEQMVYANTLRGDDSTGVIAVERDSSFHIVKDASPGYWFMPQYDATQVSKDMWVRGKAIIGHNRKKTIGGVSDETAHPFVEGDDFAMVHNGTLYNHRALADTEVDSQALTKVLAAAFENEDYQTTLEETLGKVNGAYAVAMYDQRHNRVRLLRNKERPMSMVETKDAIFFASEGGMLFWILSRNGISFKDVKIEIVPEHTVVDICLDTNTVTQTAVTPKKPTPPIIIHTPAHGGKTTTAGNTKKTTGEGLSKNAFKKFRRKFLNKRVEWWCEDYIETNFPRTETDGETLFTITGVSDGLAEDHLIKALADLKDLHFPRGKDLCDRLWTGVITDMIYDKRAKRMVLEVDHAVPVPASFITNKKAIPKPEDFDSLEVTTNAYGEPCKRWWKEKTLVAELTFAEIYGYEKETKLALH